MPRGRPTHQQPGGGTSLPNSRRPPFCGGSGSLTNGMILASFSSASAGAAGSKICAGASSCDQNARCSSCARFWRGAAALTVTAGRQRTFHMIVERRSPNPYSPVLCDRGVCMSRGVYPEENSLKGVGVSCWMACCGSRAKDTDSAPGASWATAGFPSCNGKSGSNLGSGSGSGSGSPGMCVPFNSRAASAQRRATHLLLTATANDAGLWSSAGESERLYFTRR